MRKNLAIICVFLFLQNCIYSQNGGTFDNLTNGMLPKIVLPSPEAASLAKYSVWPVSQYTGVANISIPVYTVSVKDFNLPITLNYHSGGVKVDDISSWTGVNWSLSAGGMIGRTVVGLPDDEVANGWASQLAAGMRIKSGYDLSNPSDYYFLKRVADEAPSMDSESDIYYYNFAGNSGSFFLDTALNIRTVPVSNLQFLKTPYTDLAATFAPKEWIIADERGNRYYFTQEETTRIGLPNANSAVTAYYISRIQLANSGETISFEYEAKNESYMTAPTHSCKVLLNDGFLGGYPVPWQDYFKTNQILYNGKTFTEAQPGDNDRLFVTEGSSKLKKIIWSGGQLIFYANTNRQDMRIGNMLDSIAIFDADNKHIKTVNMSYDYVRHRYFLKSVSNREYRGSKNEEYKFDYDNADLLPERNFSGSPTYYCPQDHWGFYNRGANNTNLLPPDAKMPPIVTSLLTGTRQPDTMGVKYGSLSQITYPTGGYTRFDFEANRYQAGIPSSGEAPPAPIITANQRVESNIVQPFTRSATFTPTVTQNNASMLVEVKDYAYPTSKDMGPLPYVKIVHGSGSQLYYMDAHDAFPSNLSPNVRGLYDYTFTVPNIQLQAGISYTLIVGDTCLRPFSCFDIESIPYIPQIVSTLSYSTYSATSPENGAPNIAGGLRVKQISDFSELGKLQGRRVFDYSWGNLISYPSVYTRYYDFNVGVPIFQYTGGIGGGGVVVCDSWAKLIEETSMSQTILGFTQGATVGYSDVKEIEIGDGDNDKGYTNYIFSFYKDSLNELNYDGLYWPEQRVISPLMPSNSYDYKRGLLLSKSIYKKNGSTYVKVDSLYNNYAFNDYNQQNYYFRNRNLRIKKLRFGSWMCSTTNQGYTWPQFNTTPDFSYSYYDNITSWVQLVSSTHTQYDQDGNNPLTVLTSYEYNNKNLLAKKITTQNSRGGTIVSNTTYPVDYTLTGSITDNIAKGVKSLQDHFVIGAPVEQFVQKADANSSVYKTISSAFITYKPLDPSPDVIFKTENKQPLADFTPAIITASNSLIDPRYKPVLHFNKYDSHGNILEQQKANDVKEVYLWGYQSQYPVVKIIGSDLATVLNIAALDTAALNNGTPAQKQAQVTLIRDHFLTNPLVQVSTYTYQPLVGITSETDPTGRTISYEYDAFNRLKLQKDEQGNILKKYCYNYAGQPIDCN